MFAVGPNTVTWTGAGRERPHRHGDPDRHRRRHDQAGLHLRAGPIALNNCGPANLGQATAVDDCAGTPTMSNNAPPIFPVGPTVVTWTARDASNNMSTATQTVTVTDTVPPTVTCTPLDPPGGGFRADVFDACTSTPSLRLGTYALTVGEHIKIEETGKPGISHVNTVNGIRHFLVGKGEAIIVATDGSGNVAQTYCR